MSEKYQIFVYGGYLQHTSVRVVPGSMVIDKLTPGRVAQAMGIILESIGTPARSPKPRGKSPGWKLGQLRQRRIRYPIVKKTTPKPRKQKDKSA